MNNCPNYEIKQGIDKNWYAVFSDGYEADIASNFFENMFYRIASFGQYSNALQLTDYSTLHKSNSLAAKVFK